MRIRSALAVVGVFCVALGSAQIPVGAGLQPRANQDLTPAEAERLLARGIELHQAGDTIGAIEAYGDALKAGLDRADLRSNLGAAYARLGRYPAAIEQYQEALKAAPSDATVRFNLALAYYKSARLEDAARELAIVVAAAPANKSALVLLADCSLQRGDNRKVIDVLTPHEAAFGEDRAFAYLLGTALVRDQQIERGQLVIDRIFRGGDSAEGRVLMGTSLLAQQDWPAAAKEFARAVELNPELPGLNSLYGRALLGAGDTEAATRAFRRELDLNPNDFDANLYLGNLRKQEQRIDEALAYFRRAVDMRPHDPSAVYAVASAHVALGRNDEARQTLERLVEVHPTFTEAHVLLATTYYRLKLKEAGDRERAVVDRLNAEKQAGERGAQPTLAAPYRGEIAPTKPPR